MTHESRTYRTKAGRILTDADIEALAEEAERGYDVRRPGRPRMGAGPAVVVPIRLHRELHVAVKDLAATESTSLSELIREALRTYLTGGPPIRESLRTRSGHLLTSADIDTLAAEAETGYDVSPLRGRSSVRTHGRAQVVPVRMPPELKGDVERRAEAEATSVSEIVRAALRARLSGDDPESLRGGSLPRASRHDLVSSPETRCIAKEEAVPTPSLFGTRVPRLCRVRTGTDSDEEPFPLDDDGFLDASVTIATTADELVPGMLVRPSVAASVGGLVLLGEPGVGKTTVFRDLTVGLAELADAKAGEPALLHLDAARLTDANFEALLARHFRQLPTRAHPSSADQRAGAPALPAPPAWTLVIDQLDESPMLRRFAPELAAALRDRDTAGLRILIACRTADYPPAITEVLSSALGGCVVADLAPLTRAQAVTLAESAGVSGEDLLEAATGVGAGALASVPLTLELLVRVYLTEGRLPPTAGDVFAHGVRRLTDEHDPDRRHREAAGPRTR